MGDLNETVKSAARWSGFIAAICTAVLGVLHVCYSNAEIEWPPEGVKFTADVNGPTWRDRLFSLDPDIFIDHWTPAVFGFVGWLIHFESFGCRIILASFSRFFVFNMIMGLFATIGYRGGLGIIFSIPVWITCLFSFLAFVLCDDTADLNIAWKFWDHLHGAPRKNEEASPEAAG